MLSARAGEEAAVEGLAAGADDYLVKPFSSRELIARVRANLDLAELRQAAARATERHAQLLRDLADAAVAINRAATVPAVLEVAVQRARALVDAEWTLARLDGELAGAEAAAPDPVRRVALTGSTGRALGELLLAGEFGTGGVEADAVLTQLAQVASTRLENALLYEHEHRVAETLQRSPGTRSHQRSLSDRRIDSPPSPEARRSSMCPLPLWERAARWFSKREWVRGSACAS